MHEHDFNRVEFYSKEDLAGGFQLSKGESILRNETKLIYEDINDVLELYNIKKYIDNDLYLKSWTEQDIEEFKGKVTDYEKIIGKFMSKINDNNILSYFEKLLDGYITSFLELVNNQKIYKQISVENFATILANNSHEIRSVLTHKNIVIHYKTVLRDFLLTYSHSAEILLSIYEEKNELNDKVEMFLPPNLTIQDKENIISNYIDRENCNSNYLRLILNARNKSDFKITDKTRLKAKRKEKEESDKIFEERINASFIKYGVSISFPENPEKIKDGYIKDLIANYSYSLSYIKQNNDNYSLFKNFTKLFEYLDNQNRINLVSKRSQLQLMERIMGIHSQNEYRFGITFNMSEITSHAQIVCYNHIITELGKSLEDILQNFFTSILQEKYSFANNSRLLMPTATIAYFEKIILFAPQFERVLKQYKLFVENGEIDFELLEISSTPCSIKDIPSLIQNKYIYLNEENSEIIGCSNLFFSDQASLAYVNPFKDKHYHNFFDLLANEQVNFDNYEEYQKHKINYLIDKGFLYLDIDNYIQISNFHRVLILKDLYENEFASFHYYPAVYQKEAKEMETLEMILIDSSLFSKQEQNYFNYFLNKSEFTNGLDLRNSYLHGTQSNPEEIKKHEYAYYTYLKLFVLILLKIEDDLFISRGIAN